MNGAAVGTEVLQWHEASQRKPDSDITVLCWDGETPFFCGYWDDSMQSWIGCESGGSVLGVTHWAEPAGPDVPMSRARTETAEGCHAGTPRLDGRVKPLQPERTNDGAPLYCTSLPRRLLWLQPRDQRADGA